MDTIFPNRQKLQKKQFSGCILDIWQLIKTQNGAAMSVGRVSTFLDIYIQRDLENGTITEKEAQELIDHFVMKLRMVKFARIPSYNQLFSGDPVWATLEVGGIGVDGRSMVTKNDYPFPAYSGKYGTEPGAEPDRSVFLQAAGELQEVSQQIFPSVPALFSMRMTM